MIHTNPATMTTETIVTITVVTMSQGAVDIVRLTISATMTTITTEGMGAELENTWTTTVVSRCVIGRRASAVGIRWSVKEGIITTTTAET